VPIRTAKLCVLDAVDRDTIRKLFQTVFNEALRQYLDSYALLHSVVQDTWIINRCFTPSIIRKSILSSFSGLHLPYDAEMIISSSIESYERTLAIKFVKACISATAIVGLPSLCEWIKS